MFNRKKKPTTTMFDEMEGFIARVKKQSCARWFRERVNPIVDGCPDYYEVIKRPMDLGTMSVKLHAKHYETLADIEADFELIYRNCEEYNQLPEHEVRRACNKLREYVRTETQKLKEHLERKGFDLDGSIQEQSTQSLVNFFKESATKREAEEEPFFMPAEPVQPLPPPPQPQQRVEPFSISPPGEHTVAFEQPLQQSQPKPEPQPQPPVQEALEEVTKLEHTKMEEEQQVVTKIEDEGIPPLPPPEEVVALPQFPVEEEKQYPPVPEEELQIPLEVIAIEKEYSTYRETKRVRYFNYLRQKVEKLKGIVKAMRIARVVTGFMVDECDYVLRDQNIEDFMILNSFLLNLQTWIRVVARHHEGFNSDLYNLFQEGDSRFVDLVKYLQKSVQFIQKMLKQDLFNDLATKALAIDLPTLETEGAKLYSKIEAEFRRKDLKVSIPGSVVNQRSNSRAEMTTSPRDTKGNMIRFPKGSTSAVDRSSGQKRAFGGSASIQRPTGVVQPFGGVRVKEPSRLMKYLERAKKKQLKFEEKFMERLRNLWGPAPAAIIEQEVVAAPLPPTLAPAPDAATITNEQIPQEGEALAGGMGSLIEEAVLPVEAGVNELELDLPAINEFRAQMEEEEEPKFEDFPIEFSLVRQTPVSPERKLHKTSKVWSQSEAETREGMDVPCIAVEKIVDKTISQINEALPLLEPLNFNRKNIEFSLKVNPPEGYAFLIKDGKPDYKITPSPIDSLGKKIFQGSVHRVKVEFSLVKLDSKDEEREDADEEQSSPLKIRIENKMSVEDFDIIMNYEDLTEQRFISLKTGYENLYFNRRHKEQQIKRLKSLISLSEQFANIGLKPIPNSGAYIYGGDAVATKVQDSWVYALRIITIFSDNRDFKFSAAE